MMLDGAITSEAVRNVFCLQNRMRMAHCELLLQNKQGVWNESSCRNEELAEKMEKHRGRDQGWKGTKRPVFHNCSFRSSPFLSISLCVCIPHSDTSNLHPHPSENAPRPILSPFCLKAWGYKSHRSPRSQTKCLNVQEKREVRLFTFNSLKKRFSFLCSNLLKP